MKTTLTQKAINQSKQPESKAFSSAKSQPGFTKNATTLAARFPLEHKVPLPVQLRHFEHTPASDSFRNFGINE